MVLTYDDALNEQLSHAIPALDSIGLKGTFYLSDYFSGLQQQIPGWRKAAAKGHELGNHTVFHPCAGNLSGRQWVKPDYDLSRYTLTRITDEIKAMNTLLYAIDGKSIRTFAFPCSDLTVNDTPYINGLKNELIAARAVRNRLSDIDSIDVYNINCFMVNGESGEQLIDWVKKAEANGKLLVILFHGVGGGHSLNVSLTAHHQLLQYLKQHQKDIWVAPMLSVVQYINQRKKEGVTVGKIAQ